MVFWLDTPSQPGEIEAAVRAHFEYVIERNRRARRRGRRIGQVTLAMAVILVVGVIALSQFVVALFPGNVGTGIKEGLTIFSWVVMWRPVEVLIYDWIPARRELTNARRLLAAPIDVRANIKAE